MRASEDGELLPPVVVEVPDVLYLQVVDTDDCEDWPAPSEPSERTFTTERLNASDVAYVPAARAEAELETVREAAHMPDDWPHGLPSWIAQRLYAAYIGAAFSPDVMEQIRAGRLTFPEAPIYAERDALRAQLDALPALPIRIEARCCHCDKPATIARTYYDSGFPSAREHLCPEHADNHPWHGTAIPPVARPKPGIGWNDTAPGDGGEEAA